MALQAPVTTPVQDPALPVGVADAREPDGGLAVFIDRHAADVARFEVAGAIEGEEEGAPGRFRVLGRLRTASKREGLAL